MSLPATGAGFLEVLAEQRGHYAMALPAKLAAMWLLWREVATGKAGPDGMERLAQAAHGLAGSGAVFGYGEMGAEARAIELALQRAAEEGLGPPPGMGLAIERLQRFARDPA